MSEVAGPSLSASAEFEPPGRIGRRRLLALHGIVIVLCLLLGAALSFTRGQDINGDQLNYHYYSAYAFATDRLGQDVAPAQVMHSYFSPYVYLPFYFMVRNLPPSLVGMGLGALHGLNLWLVFVIARIVTRSLAGPARIVVTIAAVAISAASPMAVSEFGTTFADLLVSLPVLAGVALLMRADFADRPVAWTTASIALAGALLGAAVSLKLTSAAFAIGLAAAALIGWHGWRQRITAMLATGLGGIAGFAAAGGWWYLRMWRMFGNPVFPYFNTVFRSPDYPSQTALFDSRYLPHSIGQALSYPFLWVASQTLTSEEPFRDPRFAFLILLGIGILALSLWLRDRSPSTGTSAERRLLAFIAVSFCVWQYEWSIQRYIVGLELLMGPAIVVLLLWGGAFTRVGGRTLAASALVLGIGFLATMKAPNWGRLGWRQAWYVIDIPPASNNAPIYFLDGEPTSFVVPALPPRSSVVGIVAWEDIASWGDTVFQRRIHELLADPNLHQVQAIASKPLSDNFKRVIGRYGLRPDGECTRTGGRPWPLFWCPLARTAAKVP